MSDDWLGPVAGVTPGGAGATRPALPAPDASSLAALVDRVESASGAGEAHAAVAAWMAASEHHPAVAALLRADEGAVQALLVRLGAVRGLKQAAAKVGSLLAKQAKLQEAAARAARRDAGLGSGGPGDRDLAALLGRDGLPPGLRCPSRWELGRDHLHLLVPDGEDDVKVLVVANRPILVTARFRDVVDGTTSLRIEWATAGGWKHRVVPRATVMDSRAFVALSAWDAPVHSDNARNLVCFLAEFEDANADVLPEARVSSTMGWQGGATDAFLWGRTLIRRGVAERHDPVEDLEPSEMRDGDVYLLADPGAAELATAFRASGTWDGWLQVAALARPYPAVWIALYAALVPPLMPLLLTLPNFILDIAGETSLGKTTTLRFAGSAWGCPDERVNSVVRTWDSTRVWIERAAGVLGNLPLILDDTKRAKKPEDVARTLYDVASGAGRGRGSVGGIRDTGRWRTVLLSTGEAPATSFTQDGGTRARTLGFWGSPFGGADEETVVAVTRLTAGVLEHHGHLGPRLVRWLVDGVGAATVVRAHYTAAVATWTERANTNPVATRTAQYLAALDVVAHVVHDLLGVPRPAGEPLERAWDSVCAASHDADRASDALREVLSWATSQQARFWGQAAETGPGNDAPNGGWLGTWASGESWTQLAILPTALREFLGRQGFDTDAILRTWAGRGWLLVEAPHRTRKVTVDGRKARCVVLTRAACDAVSEAGDA
jgi:putative DNA primase/helicase